MRKVTRKKLIIILVALSIVGLMYFSFYISFASGLLGFITGKFGAGKKAGIPGRIRSVVIPWREYQLHLHHWMLMGVAIVICSVTGFYIFSQQIFFGFMSGLLVQGVYCYDDWNRILKLKVKPAIEDLGLVKTSAEDLVQSSMEDLSLAQLSLEDLNLAQPSMEELN